MKSKMKIPRIRNKFTQEEDDKLRELVGRYGNNKWKEVSMHMPNRNQRQCRERWKHYLSCEKPENIPWSPEEDAIIIQKIEELGFKWTKIARELNGRTDIQVKYHYFKNLRNQSHHKTKMTNRAKLQEQDKDEDITNTNINIINNSLVNNNSNSIDNNNSGSDSKRPMSYLVDDFSRMDEDQLQKLFESFNPNDETMASFKLTRTSHDDFTLELAKQEDINSGLPTIQINGDIDDDNNKIFGSETANIENLFNEFDFSDDFKKSNHEYYDWITYI